MEPKNFYLIFLFIFLIDTLSAQEKYALIIGIDQYEPPKNYKPALAVGRAAFPNLDGCKNDGLSVKSVISSRFLFPEDHIVTLLDENATRKSILQAINDLLNKTKSGDIAFIYYAGHGSQVYNSLSDEIDKKDEAIVPADAWKEGIEDIRDKELAKLFNSILDRSVKLTVIFDCCHSASMSRGAPVPGTRKFRFIPGKDKNIYDAKDSSHPTPPESRKGSSFLALSAARDDEPAEEQYDDSSPSHAHGAFTAALLEAINQQTIDASTLNLFTTIRAIIKSNGKTQEPMLVATPARQQQTLFGIEKGTLANRSLVAIAGFINNKVILQGGFALGLHKQNELIRVQQTDTTVLIIDSVLGVNKSLASVKKGNAALLKAGELFEVSNWVSSYAPLLKLYMPSSDYSEEQIMQLAQIDQQLKASGKVVWINDLEKNDPYFSVFFDKGKCYTKRDTGVNKEVKNYSADAILDICKKDSTVYFELPYSGNLLQTMLSRFTRNKSISIVNNPSQANYVIYGTINENGKPAYGLRRLHTSAIDSLESMPLQTKSITLLSFTKEGLETVADSLYEYAMKLSKIRGWLQLAGPRSADNYFTYHLEIVNTDSNKTIITNTYRINDNISVHLVADKNDIHHTEATRYIYIFGIDRSGSMQLFYPAESDGNTMNRFPKVDGNEMVKDVVIASYPVPKPSGTDNFFLLTTSEPIPNYSVIFTQEGVRGPVVKSAFGDLLGLGNVDSRGIHPILSNNWSLQKLSFKCTY